MRYSPREVAKYTILGAYSQEDLTENGALKNVGKDTLKEAKACAKDMVSKNGIEYSQVILSRTKEVIADFFGKKSEGLQCGGR